MKIIHTGDWHLGHQLYNYDREEEQLYMLRQIERLVAAEQPDALLVSGDVYHTAQPPATVQKMFADAMVRMHVACPAMHIIVTAGNHDSGARHEVFSSAWETLRVHAVGQIDRADPGRHVIRVGGKGFVVAVPYVSSRSLPPDFYRQATAIAQQRNEERLPVVLMAHTMVDGADSAGHEDAAGATVGGIDALPLDAFGTDYDYLALGHIHRAQWVHGSHGRARYAGTPLAVSFDETYRHTVSVVEIDARGGKPALREVEPDILRPLVTLPAGEPLPWDEAREALSHFTPCREGTYLRLAVRVDDFLPPGADDAVRVLAEKCGCRFCHIRTTREERIHAGEHPFSVDELRREQPVDLARRYARDQGVAWDDDMAAMFREVERMVAEDTRNE